MSSRRLRSDLSGQEVGQSGRSTRRHDHDGHLDQTPPHTDAAAAAIVAIPGPTDSRAFVLGCISLAGSGSDQPIMVRAPHHNADL